MMTCDDARLTYLSDLVDGELCRRDRADVQAHLAGCDACSGVPQDLQHVRRAAGIARSHRAARSRLAPGGRAGAAGAARGAAAAAPAARRAALAQWLGLAAALIVVTVGALISCGQHQIFGTTTMQATRPTTASVKRWPTN